MENTELFNKINNVIDAEFKTLVGMLCKRIEVLERERCLSSSLYKALTKEQIYEFSRHLKKILELHIKIGKVEFKTIPKED